LLLLLTTKTATGSRDYFSALLFFGVE